MEGHHISSIHTRLETISEQIDARIRVGVCNWLLILAAVGTVEGSRQKVASKFYFVEVLLRQKGKF